jgi:hypothetical protein
MRAWLRRSLVWAEVGMVAALAFPAAALLWAYVASREKQPDATITIHPTKKEDVMEQRRNQGTGNGTALFELPNCQKCNEGKLLCFSDYGQEGASVIFKTWACSNPTCGFYVRADKGEIKEGKWIEVIARVASSGK